MKKAILHHKNSLFYKSERGTYVGDIFMSLIYTCHLCDVDPFDYLTTLQRHAAELSSDPAKWMPEDRNRSTRVSRRRAVV